MREEKNRGGIYIAVCSLAVIAGVIGFLGRHSKKEEPKMPPVEKVSEAQSVEKEESVIEKEEIYEVPAEDSVSVSKATIIEETRFIRPVDGKVIEEFSDNNLIYNEALRDWRTHNGIDLEADSGTQVIAAANGVVENIFDSNMGTSVLIDHQNGYKTVYANLDDSIAVKKGDEVAEGDVIGIVGNTALGDATDIPHLHFEITKNGENVNPVEYME